MAFNGEIERLYALPEPDFPNLAHRSDPEQVADFVRRKRDLDERPIDSMMQLLESKGVRIFSLPADAANAGTFSLWHRTSPSCFSTPRNLKTSSVSISLMSSGIWYCIAAAYPLGRRHSKSPAPSRLPF